MKALSLRQPWCWAVVHYGKGIENRKRNIGLPQEPFLIHAALACTKREYAEAVAWMLDRKLIMSAASVPDLDTLDRGGIVGVARVAGLLPPYGKVSAFADLHPRARDTWRMDGQYAYVLEDVRAVPLIPCRAYLGFFGVPEDIAAKARDALAGSEAAR